MAEAKKNYANIENINSLLGAEGVGKLMKSVQGTEKKVGEIMRKLSELEAAARQRAQEEAAKAEAAQKAAEISESKPAASAPAESAEAKKAEPAKKEVAAEAEPAPAKEAEKPIKQE